ncbi:hypothetical protein L7F22_002948 [Adiantum nelumboides]|nr:hypothetical protein [Adiantum nelumboides]
MKLEKPQKVMEASVTISVGGGDVDVGLLACMQEFLEKKTLAGICSVEHGRTLLHLHLQMVVRMWSTLFIAINKMVKNYLGWAKAPPPGGIVLCRALTQRRLHTFEVMDQDSQPQDDTQSLDTDDIEDMQLDRFQSMLLQVLGQLHEDCATITTELFTTINSLRDAVQTYKVDVADIQISRSNLQPMQSCESSSNSITSLIQQAKYVPKGVRTTSSAASSRSTRSKKSSSEEERTKTDKEQDSQESTQEDVPREAEAVVPSEYESDEEDTSIPLERKSQKPRSREQVLMDEAMARVKARRKELADARAAKATTKTIPMTLKEARQIRIEKAKAIQKERRRIEVEEKAQKEAKAAQVAQTQEKEVVDLSGTIEYLKKLEREKHTAEQQTAQLAREKIKEALSRKAEEPVLEPTQGRLKRPRQEEDEEIEHIQADPIPPSPINIPPAPPSTPITPFPPASTPQTPPSPSPLDIPKSPPAPTSPQ